MFLIRIASQILSHHNPNSFSIVSIIITWFLIFQALAILPGVHAVESNIQFPNISFAEFSTIIEQDFNKHISLATVLSILFSILRNPNLFALHYKQKSTRIQTIPTWGRFLARKLLEKFDKQTLDNRNNHVGLLSTLEFQSADHKVIALTAALERLIAALGIEPTVNNLSDRPEDDYVAQPVNENAIKHVLVLTPEKSYCRKCIKESLKVTQKERDIPTVKVIQGTTLHEDASVLAGECSKCRSIFYPDHDSYVNQQDPGKRVRFYRNNCSFLKIGRNLWGDRQFAKSLMNGLYSFSSISSFANYWTKSYWPSKLKGALTRRHVWQCFMQESTREVAAALNKSFGTPDGLSTKQVAEHAFKYLGKEGEIPGAREHECDGCAQDYERPYAGPLQNGMAVAGVDEQGIAVAGLGDNVNVVQQIGVVTAPLPIRQTQQPTKPRKVTMVVVDGIVMGHSVCYYKHRIETVLTWKLQKCAKETCPNPLVNASTGVYCQEHQDECGNLCHVQDCDRVRHGTTKACVAHQATWKQYVIRFGRATVLGVRRLLRRSDEETLPWNPARRTRAVAPAHDADGEPALPNRKHYFSAGRYYCVETICKPCGVVLGWAKFYRSESPTQIMEFLEKMFKKPESRPSYVTIDKACLVLKRAVTSGQWNSWKLTTRFIVDTYHYINHRATDYLCRTWCNPAPTDGKAPNLVKRFVDENGTSHLYRAFNTQVSKLSGDIDNQ